eukprot:1718494-Rhodomonas_salina.1
MARRRASVDGGAGTVLCYLPTRCPRMNPTAYARATRCPVVCTEGAFGTEGAVWRGTRVHEERKAVSHRHTICPRNADPVRGMSHRNQIQKAMPAVHFGPGVRLFAFDFAVSEAVRCPVLTQRMLVPVLAVYRPVLLEVSSAIGLCPSYALPY